MVRNQYETIFVLSTKTLDDAAIEAAVEKFKNVITENGGNVESVDLWGKRKLAYPINYETEGYYVLVNFESEPTLPAELERDVYKRQAYHVE